MMLGKDTEEQTSDILEEIFNLTLLASDENTKIIS
jgi:hypothetical protein